MGLIRWRTSELTPSTRLPAAIGTRREMIEDALLNGWAEFQGSTTCSSPSTLSEWKRVNMISWAHEPTGYRRKLSPEDAETLRKLRRTSNTEQRLALRAHRFGRGTKRDHPHRRPRESATSDRQQVATALRPAGPARLRDVPRPGPRATLRRNNATAGAEAIGPTASTRLRAGMGACSPKCWAMSRPGRCGASWAGWRSSAPRRRWCISTDPELPARRLTSWRFTSTLTLFRPAPGGSIRSSVGSVF